MEIKKTNEFNKRDYLRANIAAFLQSYSKGLNLVSGKLNSINNNHSVKNLQLENEKRRILERCLALFRSTKFKALIKKEKDKQGILEQEDVRKETREENLRKIADLSQELTDRLSEVILGDLKRKYNMSELATKDMISTVLDSNGITRKDITYTPENKMSKAITDLFGNTISIHHIGRLDYKCDPSSDDYIHAFCISKRLNSEIIMEPRLLFSNIDINMLDNLDYRNAVANTLLSNNNIELSQADDYIGEIDPPNKKNASMADGQEKFESEFYTYKIPDSNYALVFDGTKIEAVRACKEQKQIQSQIQAQLQELQELQVQEHNTKQEGKDR